MKHTLYKVYGSIDILDDYMTYKELIDCIKTLYEAVNEDRMHSLYCSIYPLMDSKTFKSFDEFCGKTTATKKSVKVENKKEKTQEEILKEVERIMDSTVSVRR